MLSSFKYTSVSGSIGVYDSWYRSWQSSKFTLSIDSGYIRLELVNYLKKETLYWPKSWRTILIYILYS